MSKIISKLNLTDQGCVSIRIRSSQSIPDNTETALSAYNDILINQGKSITIDSSAKFTVHSPGIYFITGDISFATNITGYRTVYFVASNSPSYHRGQILVPTVITNNTLLSSSSVLKLAANETVTIFVIQTSGVSLNLISNSVWAAAEIIMYEL